MKKIHVGFLLSYDYEKLKLSIPPIYKNADRIFIALDKNFLTWSGNKFKVDESFFKWLKDIDEDHKIEIYRDDFYIPTLNPIQNDTRERHLLSIKMGIGNWLIQIDSDEYFINFENFVNNLRKYDHFLQNPDNNQIQFSTFLINIYKKVEGGFLYVDNATKCMTATNYPSYKYARNTRKRIIYTKHLMFHETLARDEKELEFKFSNWGHKDDINPYFLEKWKSATIDNYKSLSNLFYLEPFKWKKLNFVKGDTIDEAIHNFDTNNFAPSNFFLAKKNFGQWFKFLFKK
ncbi:hypothetical protein [Flavobacterium sp.]|jgi:hypothetical protein|uniref:hypothetical protein n=1 Tax=Flavobacterium sp. TaxID=239 RepID=UPI0037BFFD20